MATRASQQVPSYSYDDDAVSVSVSNRSSSDPRPGSFLSGDFAAVSPVYFHNLGGGKYFGVFSRRWHSVSYPHGASDPNMFSSYAEDTTPSWAIFDGKNGHRSIIPGHGSNNITTNVSGTRTLSGACGRANSYLYVLQSCTSGGTTNGVISHYFINPVIGQVNLLGEETIPNATVNGETVVFDRGVKYGPTYLNFVGHGLTSGKMYLSRKNWGRIGTAASPIEYQGAKGWLTDPSTAAPLVDSTGTPLTTAGPVSFADYQGRTWMSTTQNSSGVMTSQIYSSAGLWEGWTPQGQPYPLGTTGSSYLGGTAHLQPSLRANQARVGATSVSGIPVCWATKSSSGSNSGISIHWDLWPVNVPNAARLVTAGANLTVSPAPSALAS